METKLKIAIVQDWFTLDGGAEKVCRELINVYPDADIYSLIDFLSEEDREKILAGKKSQTSIIQGLPFARKFYRYYLNLFPYAIEQINLEKYDLIISSSYSVAKGVLCHSEQMHISYCHSPMRYIWDLYFQYIQKPKWYNWPINYFIRKSISKLRIWDVISSNRVDYFIANSQNVANRIKKVYQRDAKVIYPPLYTERYKLQEQKQDYFITASRLVSYKRVDLIIQAFQSLPNEKLVIVGKGPELNRIKKLASKSSNIEVKGFVEQQEYSELIQNAKAFINASFEDFGIAPVEAQACGTPVIGYAKGGILETTKENKTAIYFRKQDAISIQNAIQTFNQSELWSASEIRQFALTFSNERFRTEIEEFVSQCLQS